MKRYFKILLLFCFFACQHIETGETLSQKQIDYIKGLGLLDEGEAIILFYSEYKKEVAGNFFTSKRMASYWIDETDISKNQQNFAFYPDIADIDTNYMRNALTYTPYLEVIRKDSTRFRLSVEGKEKDVKQFFEEAIKKWKASKSN